MGKEEAGVKIKYVRTRETWLNSNERKSYNLKAHIKKEEKSQSVN